MELKRAVVVANGEVTDLELIKALIRPEDHIIAVDGGLRHLPALNRDPLLLIGDLDSVLPSEVEELRGKGIEIIRYPVEKDETDLELAILKVVERGYPSILLVGVTGGRLDHTLGNLYLLLLPQLEGIEISAETGSEEIFLIRSSRRILGKKGDRVSLLPFKGEVHGVQTRGLQYPLLKETLFMEKSRGISNVMTADQAEVIVESGCLLCIHTRMDHLEEK
ncbi:MAG: thiamine diphosphokinase [Chloroflexi bacterium]|nr:thiamine diphosphokinase [Chloroflexota bacterium]